MNIILFIALNFTLGTLTLILGVNMMSRGLEQANSEFIKKVVNISAGNTVTAFIMGTFITALVQSSSAVTILTVSFVNSGIMQLKQAIAIVIGANIGTTVTSQFMTFKIHQFALQIIISGVLLYTFSKKHTIKSLSIAIIGFGLMFSGISIFNKGIPYIKDNPFTIQLFEYFGNNIILSILTGVVITMLVQSSSATVGLTILLFNSDLLSFESAIGFILGDNIGTCISAQLSSIGTNIHAKQTAWAHTLYNLIGVFLALALIVPFSNLVKIITDSLGQDKYHLIANSHTVFNITSAIIFLPFLNYFVYFVKWVVRK